MTTQVQTPEFTDNSTDDCTEKSTEELTETPIEKTTEKSVEIAAIAKSHIDHVVKQKKVPEGTPHMSPDPDRYYINLVMLFKKTEQLRVR